MGNLFSSFAGWLNPIYGIVISSTALVTFLLGALADPTGVWNEIVNSAIDVFVGILPTHPPQLTLGAILASADAVIPGYGATIIGETATTVSAIFAIVALIKVYKLIPFKFS